MAYCPKCKETFDTQGGFCPYDGTTLQGGTVPGSGPPGQSKIRAISAAEHGIEAVRKMAGDRDNEYDRLIGTTLDGRYTIEKKLGEGGMGVVFLGRHTIIEKPVAIKVLKKEVARDHSVVKRFVQEAKAASRIGHANIVDVTDFGTTPDGLTYSVMEFVEGETLSALIKREAPLGVDRTVPIIIQIARALGAAHDKGIVHRDLKPENAFVLGSRGGRADFVKIVDFGIAKVMPVEGNRDGPRLTRAGSVFGTPEYMAPEQAAGRSDTDRRVDIYALGTILYEMLVGKVPHKAKSTVRTLAMQMLDPIPPPKKANPDIDIPDKVERAMMKALAKKREERYSTMAELIADLEAAIGASGTTRKAAAGGPASASADDRTLIPLPPGADAMPTHKEAASSETVHEDLARDTDPDPLTVAARGGQAKSGNRSRRPSKGDPAFVGRGSPLRLDFDDDDDQLPTRSRWPVILLLLLILGGGGAAIAFMMSQGDDEPKGAGTDLADAGALVEATVDAATAADATAIAEGPIDAGAGPTVVRTNGTNKTPNNPRDPKDPGPVINPKVRHKVQVITKPERATLYVGGTYAGTGDTYITRAEGTRLDVTCRLPGFTSGTVDVVFDGTREVYLCTLKRIKKCVKDLKNPFDDCPE